MDVTKITKKMIRKNSALYSKLSELNYFRIYKRNKKLIDDISIEYLLKVQFKEYMEKELNLDSPTTFNEKIQWLKAYWFDKDALICANKYLVRDYLQNRGLGHILNDLIAIYKSPEEINFNDLPDKFVLKPTHDSGHTIICDDKNKLDKKKVILDLKKWIAVDYEYLSGEWVYALEKYIICEKFMDCLDKELIDYKFWCFNGKVVYISLYIERFSSSGLKVDIYDREWNLLPFIRHYPNSGIKIDKPPRLREMIEYAEILAGNFPFVRVDLYDYLGNIVFGELTFFPGGGLLGFQPESADYEMGNKLVLPAKSKPWHIIKTLK
jgi:hypothetical protein